MIVKIIFYAIFVLALAYIFIKALPNFSDPIPAVLSAASSPVLGFVPGSGWLSMLIRGLFNSTPSLILTSSGLLAAFCIFGFVFFSKFNPDFYEDVLQATEKTHSAITASKEGKIQEYVPKNVKLGKTGITKGEGVGVFFYKHQLEARRTSAILLDPPTIVMVIVNIALSYFMRDSFTLFLITSSYLQFFVMPSGRWAKELRQPYVYMIPEKPFKKLLNLLKQNVFLYILEAVIIYIPVSFIMGLNIAELVACVFARFSLAMLFTSVNILLYRIFGTVPPKGYQLVIAIFLAIILIVPGMAVGFAISSAELFISMPICMSIPITISNLTFSMLLFFIGRNFLEYSELNNR